jgi:hypothetical protein
MSLPDFDSVVFLRDVYWLLDRCPEGKTISGTCTHFFLDLVDEEEPVEIVRIHHESVVGTGDTQRVVALMCFEPKAGGPPMLNEVVCHGDDLLRVAKYVRCDPDDEMTPDERARMNARRKELQEANAVTGAPWEQDVQKWRELLSGN